MHFNDFEEQEMSEKRDTKDGNKRCEKEVLVLLVIKNIKCVGRSMIK